MRNRGTGFGGAVALGVLLAHTVLPLSSGAAAVGTLAAAGAALGNVRAWILVPAGLGVLRAARERESREDLSVPGPLRAEGLAAVVAEQGTGRLVRAGERTVLVADTLGALPPPGRSARVTLRLDPIRSRAERSSFRADLWAASRGIDGRGRCVGAPAETVPTPGVAGAVRRAVWAVRERARRRLGHGRSPSRDLVTALVIGDRTGLERTELDAFRRAGLAHVLALSGMHVGVLALGLRALLRAMRLPSSSVAAATIAFLGAFAVMTGGSAPILRACGTGAMAIAAGGLSRRLPPGHALGLVAGALLLARPSWLFDAGFRLSFLAAGTLALWARHTGKPGRGARGALRGLADGLAMSACVTFATAPEILASFGSVSVLSPLTNLLAALPATLALGWGALAAFAPVPDAFAAPFGSAASAAASVLLFLADAAARLPGGAVTLPAPPPGVVLVAMGAVFAFAARLRPRDVPRRLVVVAAALLLPSALPRDRLTVLDLGQGDAILVEGGGGAVLVDTAGGPFRGRPAPVAAALDARRFRPLDALVLTHGHADHSGGAASLLAAGRTRALVTRGDAPDDALAALRAAAAADRLSLPDPGGRGVPLLGGRLTVGEPWPEGAPEATGENERSLATRWTAGRCSAWLLGDGGFEAEEALLAAAAAGRGPGAGGLRAAILVAAHHGSRGSTSPALLAAVRPRLALVSCGEGNPYGHPHGETLARLREAGAALLRIDRDGTVAVTATARGFRVRWTRDFPGPRALLPGFPLGGRGGFP